MLIATALSLFFLFWTTLFLADFYLRTAQNEKYLAFVERRGLSITLFQIRFYLSRSDNANSYSSLSFMRSWSSTAGQRALRCLLGWFSIGALVGLICFAVTPLYLTWLLVVELSNVTRILRWRLGSSAVVFSAVHPLAAFLPSPTLAPLEQEDVNFKVAISDLNSPESSLFYIPLQEHVQTGITPVIPGVNIPWSHLPLFMFVLVIAGVFHELGHAVAAINANVRLNGFGIFLFAVYPGAFTELETDELSRSSSAQKLRIFTAGIWHNIILALFGVLVVWCAPIFFMPFYESGKGVVVTDVSEKSGLYGANGLQPGHIVIRINQCRVGNSTEWTQCLERMHNRQIAGAQKAIGAAATSGYLVQYAKVLPLTASPANVFDATQSGEVQCCAEFGNVTPSHICFRYYPTLAQIFKPPNGVALNSDRSTSAVKQGNAEVGLGRPNRVPQLKVGLNKPAKNDEKLNMNQIDQPILNENERIQIDKLDLSNIKRKFTSEAPNFADSLGLKNRAKRSVNLAQDLEVKPKEHSLKRETQNTEDEQKDEKQEAENVELTDDKLHTPKVERSKARLEKVIRHACLPARQITDHVSCEQFDEYMDVKRVPEGYVCVTPALYNGTALLRFELKNRSRPVLFVGFLSEPLYMIDLMDVTPRFDWIPYWIPLVVELFGKYLLTFSLAMALLNAVPCHGLDGQFMCETVVDYFCGHKPTEERYKICNRIVTFGTAVFSLNVSIGLIKFLFNYWR